MIRNENETPEEFMDRTAREQWQNVQGEYLIDCVNALTKAGTSAEAFHKFEYLREILDMVDNPEYATACAREPANIEDSESSAIAGLIRDYLQESWTRHRAGFLYRVQMQEGETAP